MVSSLLSACSHADKKAVDQLNEISYSYQYKNIDSSLVYAKKALANSKGYDAGKAEALNNLAFIDLMKMNYNDAYSRLDSVLKITNNQIELLVADVQMMRLCQRESKNKDFYDYREQAIRRQKRIEEEEFLLTEHQRKRLVYAKSEFCIVSSTYYFYVGLRNLSSKAIADVDKDLIARDDTAQYLKYLYNVGAGGVLNKGTQAEVNQEEFDYLMRCLLLARQHGYVYWHANSLQGLSEHLIIPRIREKLIKDNYPSVRFVNFDNMPDSLLAGNLAQRATDIFVRYGAVYQIASSSRTLASCYWQIKDYQSAILCLNNALSHKAIAQAPDLVASLREQLSVVYAAVNNKQKSDFNRNIYLDLQEQTRQDRYLESRAGILEKTSQQLNLMIAAVLIMIFFLIGLLFLFHYLRKKNKREDTLKNLLLPLEEWQRRNETELELLKEDFQEVQEQSYLVQTNIVKNKKRNLEKRAKMFLVNTLSPLIDRMIHEITHLKQTNDSEELRNERYTYIAELADNINNYNNVLTQWIQLKQGELSLHIESFPLQQIFDVVAKSRMGFQIKGIDLDIVKSNDIVKADKVLTLFMINTLAENARKFTDDGGKVKIASKATENYIEISVEDTGKGIDPEVLSHIFDHKVIVDSKDLRSHGYGLMNCNGIINKYKKVSKLFSVCSIGAESKVGKGSTFYFRLPKGIMRIIVLLYFMLSAAGGFAVGLNAPVQRHKSSHSILLRELDLANAYADSAYYSNINGTYERTLAFADTCRYYLNQYYLRLHPNGQHLMKRITNENVTPAEVYWLHENFPTNYSIILDIRNESAVAALALHKWELYRYSNNVYTLLFKENSADKNLGEYCRMMQKSELNKNIAIVILLLLLLSIIPIYYFMYYRHRFRFQSYVENIRNINKILLSDKTPAEKQKNIDSISTENFPDNLTSITQKIIGALNKSVENHKVSAYNLELAKDELRKMEFENNKLHVSNNILDNCLSTLKHETMYYPSRIRQLVGKKDAELNTIDELSVYYKELYSLLSMQAMRQVSMLKPVCKRVEINDILDKNMQLLKPGMGNLSVLGDPDLLRYMFEVLQKQNANEKINIEIEKTSNEYLNLKLQMTALNLSDEECLNLFMPSAENIPYMVCRQIVREGGEVSNRHRCGIVAHNTPNGTVLSITLAQAKNEKM